MIFGRWFSLMKKTIRLTITIVFISFFACKKRTAIKLPEIFVSEYDTIIQHDLKRMGRSNSIIYAMNVLGSDTVRFANSVKYKEEGYEDYDYTRRYGTDSIKVIVDPIQFFHSNLYGMVSVLPPPPPMMIDENESNYDKRYESYYQKLVRTHYEMTPVFIYNFSNKNQTVQKPLGQDLFMITEAKTEDGKWKPIEFYQQFPVLCSTGHQNYNLQPNHFIIVGTRKYFGNYKTKLRLKLKSFGSVFYSNSFEGTVNKSQFDTSELLGDENQNRSKEFFLD